MPNGYLVHTYSCHKFGKESSTYNYFVTLQWVNKIAASVWLDKSGCGQGSNYHTHNLNIILGGTGPVLVQLIEISANSVP